MKKRFFQMLMLCLLLISPLYTNCIAEQGKDPSQDKTAEEKPVRQNSGWLGVRVTDLANFIRNPELYAEYKEIIDTYKEKGESLFGIVVIETLQGSPAEEYGIIPGYIIKKLQNVRIDNSFTFSFIISRIEPGEMIELEIWNPKGNYIIYARIGERPAGRERNADSQYHERLRMEKSRPEKPDK